VGRGTEEATPHLYEEKCRVFLPSLVFLFLKGLPLPLSSSLSRITRAPVPFSPPSLPELDSRLVRSLRFCLLALWRLYFPSYPTFGDLFSERLGGLLGESRKEVSGFLPIPDAFHVRIRFLSHFSFPLIFSPLPKGVVPEEDWYVA